MKQNWMHPRLICFWILLRSWGFPRPYSPPFPCPAHHFLYLLDRRSLAVQKHSFYLVRWRPAGGGNRVCVLTLISQIAGGPIWMASWPLCTVVSDVCDVYCWCRRCLSVLPLPSHYWICRRGNVAFISAQDVMDSRSGNEKRKTKGINQTSVSWFYKETPNAVLMRICLNFECKLFTCLCFFFAFWYNTGVHIGIQV